MTRLILTFGIPAGLIIIFGMIAGIGGASCDD